MTTSPDTCINAVIDPARVHLNTRGFFRAFAPAGLTVVLAFASAVAAGAQAPPPNDKLRLIIETDAGGDPDDEQSLVRFLLYTNEWDVEGIIANRPHTSRPENQNPAATGLGVVRRLVNAYGECYHNLVLHDTRYPKPDV